MAKKKKLIVVPLAGLGNRMRVLSSCIEIAKRDNRELWIAWPVNSELGCDITDIFKSIGYDYSIPSKWFSYLLTAIYKLSTIKKYYKVYKLFSNLFFSDSIFDDDVWQAKDHLQINNNGSTLLVASCLAFDEQNFKHFQFTDHLQNEVNTEYQKIGEPYIGIHIRRTDHVNTAKHSPDENYLAQIDNCITQNPDQKFFLASDDLATKNFFKQKYKNLIFTLNHKLGREDLEGIYGGVIELILLSRSSKIICSVISSYSTAAILIGNIKDVIFVDTFLDKKQVLENGKIPKQFQNL